MSNDSLKTRKIIELLKNRHPGPEWAHFVELGTATGAVRNRLIDFYAFNLYPSKRHLKIAYEIKVSRADFALELSNPVKREPAEALADECYFVVPSGLIRPDETPEGWGLVEVVANGLRVVKRAQQRNVASLPIAFVASIARRSTDSGSPLPPAFWLVAGQEVDLDKLREVASDEIRKDVEAQIRKAAHDAREIERGSHRDAIELENIIYRKLGSNMTDPKVFTAWLDNQALRLDPFTKASLARVNEMIVKILDKENSSHE